MVGKKCPGLEWMRNVGGKYNAGDRGAQRLWFRAPLGVWRLGFGPPLGFISRSGAAQWAVPVGNE